MEEAEVVKKIPELWMWAVGLIAASFFGKFGEKIFEATFNNIKDTIFPKKLSTDIKKPELLEFGVPVILKCMFLLALFGIASSIAFGIAGGVSDQVIKNWCYVIGNSANLLANIFVVLTIVSFFRRIAGKNA